MIDTVNQKFDLLIDGKLVFDDASFRNPLRDGITHIEYYANGSNIGTAHIDNLRILQGSDRDRGDSSLSAVTTSAGTPIRGAGNSWRLDVPATTGSIEVTAVPTSDKVISVSVNGQQVQPGQPSPPITLSEGSNVISIEVVAENGTVGIHDLAVERAPLAAEASLSSLQFDKGQLSPVFAPDTAAYALVLPSGTTEVVWTPTTTGPNSTSTINGMAVASGASLTTAVADGGAVEIAVGSADGTSQMRYVISVEVPVQQSTCEKPTNPGQDGKPGNYQDPREVPMGQEQSTYVKCLKEERQPTTAS